MTEQTKTTNVEVEDLSEETIKLLEQHTEDFVKNNIFALNYLQLKTDYPLSMVHVENYMKEKANIPLDSSILIWVFLYSPRNILIDLFDKESIFMTVSRAPEGWSHSLAPLSPKNLFQLRIEAEIEGYKIAFEMLEKQIKNNPPIEVLPEVNSINHVLEPQN